ncbi:MAG: DNA polymerase I [Dysgonamonadaceae bacterium]|nr:DNA polymerase I [Dysgonamonadaceae bacterium]
MKLFLLDAYALIYRAYYALIKAPRINSKGFNTSAIFGFVNTLEDVLKKENPTHIGIAFDPHGPTFRHELFKAYKAHREETPEVILHSIPIIKDIIRAYRIPILEAPYYEADDIIGTIAKKFAGDFPVYMMTPDKDYGQLVDTNIFVYKQKHGNSEYEIWDAEKVKERYSLTHPLQLIDYMGLMGDAADNIPGCPGVGEVTAKKLIAEFNTIENLLEHTDQLKGALKEKIEENKALILLSKYLVTIKTDVPIDIDLHTLQRKKIDEPALLSLFDEMEFRQLSARVFGEVQAGPAVMKKQGFQTSLFDQPEIEMPVEAYNYGLYNLRSSPHNYSVLDDDAKIADLIKRIREQQSFTFDTETTGLDPLSSDLVGISFALKEGEAFYFPVRTDKPDKIRILIEPFKEALEDKQILKIGQNLKFDIKVLKKYGVCVDGPMFDTMIAHYLINPEYRHNMDYLAETYLHYRTIPIENLIGKGKGKKQISMRQVPLEDIVDYACEDADITLQLKNVFAETVSQEPWKNLFYNIEIPLVSVLADMEITGVRLDTQALRDSSTVLTQYLDQIERDIFQLAGQEFNINSPKMVGEILFERLKITDKISKMKSGQYSTNEEALEGLKGKHPIVEKIMVFRKTKKLLSAYINALPALIHPVDEKVHTTYNQATTSTGRLSSTNPNLQNIPIRNEEGKEIRRAFIPDPGCLFFSADYSQIELRIIAHLSQDKNMLEAFHNRQDIHAATAAKIFDIPLSEVTRGMRRKAKIANFGIIYGISNFGLAEQLHIARTDAKDLIDGYFASFPEVKDYMDRCIAFALKNGYVETIFGRRRFLPDINSRNAIVRGYARRNAINAPIQGSAADIIKVAMNRIHRRFRQENLQSRMIMQVHDELNFNVFPDELERVKLIVVQEMEQAAELRVPLIAECGVGKNWLEAH